MRLKVNVESESMKQEMQKNVSEKRTQPKDPELTKACQPQRYLRPAVKVTYLLIPFGFSPIVFVCFRSLSPFAPQPHFLFLPLPCRISQEEAFCGARM
jgi:hypothetical protein